MPHLFYNLSGNGRVGTPRNELGLRHELRSDKRLRAEVNLAKLNKSQ